jgi:hypothetical protein
VNIEGTLSAKSIMGAAKQLRKYAESLQSKSERLVKDLGEAGVEYANMYLEHDDTGETRNSIQFTQNVNTGVISVAGAAVWIEFGTGVLANAGDAPHPKKDEVGAVGWGEYGHGLGKDLWWFTNKYGKQVWTAGIHMNPFMYEAAQSLRFSLTDFAKEAFKND